MAIGAPRLLTWTNGTLSLFELTEAGFLKIGDASHAMADTNRTEIELFWPRDSKFAGVLSGTSNAAYATTYDLGLNLIQTSPSVTPSTVTGNRMGAYSQALHLVHAKAGGVGGGRGGGVIVNSDGTFGAVGEMLPNSAGGPNEARFSPDGMFVVRSFTNSVEVYTRDEAYSGTTPSLIFPATGVQDLTNNGDVKEFGWAADSSLLIAIYPTGPALAYPRTDLNTFLSPITIDGGAFGNACAVATHPNAETIAVSFEASGVYTTLVYRWDGSTLEQFAQIDNFGQLLGFTGGGTLLIDAGSQQAYAYNSSFTANAFVNSSALMSAVPAGAVMQSVSTHIEEGQSFNEGYIYDGAASDLLLNRTNLGTLKLALLNSLASFDPTHTTFAEVTNSGANEISGGGWPVGGLTLQNVSMQESTRGLNLVCLDLSTPITAEIGAKAVVVYDASTSKPVVFLEFNPMIVTSADEPLTFDFIDGVLVQIGA